MFCALARQRPCIGVRGAVVVARLQSQHNMLLLEMLTMAEDFRVCIYLERRNANAQRQREREQEDSCVYYSSILFYAQQKQ